MLALSSFTAGIAGVWCASRLRSVSTNLDGGQLVLYAVAAAVIGGTSLFGGRGKPIHAVLGGLMCFDGVMRLPPLSVSDEDRGELESWVRSRTIDARYAQRARIVLLAADGESNRAIGDVVGMHYNQVGVWRRRYVEFGVDGLDDEPRPGRPPVYDHDDVILLVKTVTESPPDPATRWTMDLLAARMAEHGVPISASQAWRICQALDLKPWQTESWMTSHDPDFWAKAGDVCGLYLNPPENAVVWSVDEKSQIQAKSG